MDGTWLSRAGRMRWRVTALAALVLGGVALLCWPSGCSQTEAPVQGALGASRTIRVRLCPAVDSAVISATRSPVYYTSTDATPRKLELPADARLPLTLSSGGWLIGNTPIGGGEVVIRQSGDGTVRINDRAYRGQFRLVPLGGGTFDVINDLDIDAYLQSVLAKELLPGWHEETYKAQAIVARTYALYEKYEPHAPREWDVYADTRSQVYGGMDVETPKSVDGAQETAGVVVAYGPEGREKIFRAYFHSCCGGATQAASQAFSNEIPFEPLREQRTGALCSASPRYNWGPVVLSKQELTRRFRLYGANPARNNALKGIGLIRSIEIAAQNSAGRPIKYAVTDARGYRYTIGAEELRWAVNTDASAQPGSTLWSGYVETIINESGQIRFQGGHGSGHGVGLCQWCAEARATAAMRHEDIVLAAYPRTKLVRAY